MPTKQISIYGEMGSKYNTLLVVPDVVEPAVTQFFLNGFFDVSRVNHSDSAIRKYSYCKRPGTTGAIDGGLTALGPFTNNYKVQGVCTSFDKKTLLFYANNGAAANSYIYDGTTLTTTAAPAGWTNTGPVVFTVLDGISYGANVYYAATDFTNGALITSAGVWTTIADADFTGLTKVTNFIGLDGYLFMGTSNNRIYNSDLNTSTSWVATSFLTADDTPGAIKWLGKLRNYLICFKENSIEFFEDTGNPTPGSPLTPQRQLNMAVGLASKSSVQEVSDGLIFLGKSSQGKCAIYKIKRDDLSVHEITRDSTLAEVFGEFGNLGSAYSVDSFVDNANNGQSQVIVWRDKEWYLINITPGGTNKRTFVYDNILGMWVRWATCLTADNTLDANFTPSQAVMFQKGTTFYNVMVQNNLIDASHAPFFVTIPTNLGTVGSDAISDNGGSKKQFPMEWISEILDFGTRKRKFLDSLEVIYEGASKSAGSTGTAQITLWYGDSDYNTNSAATLLVTRTISFDRNSKQRAIFRRLGNFRRRFFGIKQTDTLSIPFKLNGIELQLNQGEEDQEG